MGHRKTGQRDFLPWLTVNPSGSHENEKRFLMIPANMLFANNSTGFSFPKVRTSSYKLYLCMAIESGGKRIFEFSHTDAKKYGFNLNTFDSCVRELIDKNTIEVIDDPDRSQFKTKQFKFTPEKWKVDIVSEKMRKKAQEGSI